MLCLREALSDYMEALRVLKLEAPKYHNVGDARDGMQLGQSTIFEVGVASVIARNQGQGKATIRNDMFEVQRVIKRWGKDLQGRTKIVVETSRDSLKV